MSNWTCGGRRQGNNGTDKESAEKKKKTEQIFIFILLLSFYQLNEECFMRNDEQRIGMVQQLISVGSVERTLLSHDIHTKHRITRYGGESFVRHLHLHTYEHTLTLFSLFLHFSSFFP